MKMARISCLDLIFLSCLVSERIMTAASSGTSLRGSRSTGEQNFTSETERINASRSLTHGIPSHPSQEQKLEFYGDGDFWLFEDTNLIEGAKFKPSPEEKQQAKDKLLKEYLDEWHANQHLDEQLPRSLQAGNVSAAPQGRVKSLYTLGSPGSGSPGLRSIEGSCFPGVRVYSKEHRSNGWRHDPVAWIANGDWFWHPRMASASVTKDDASADEEYPCSDEGQKLPPWEYTAPWLKSLHSTETTYVPAIRKSALSRLSQEKRLTEALADLSYEKNNPSKMQDLVSPLGLNVVGAAKFEGSWDEGVQVSYLLQDPKTLDCRLTFQGTDSWQDGWTDGAAFAVPFCGLTQRGENCCTLAPLKCTGTCKPKGPNDAFVHMGFRNQLRRMTSTATFQKNIHSRLPSCRNVELFGHSLGGAMAELYTACAERSLKQGDFGYEDYEKIGWTKGIAKQLAVDASFH